LSFRKYKIKVTEKQITGLRCCFSRQRYWGEPFPVYYVNGLPQMIDKNIYQLL
jgi:valyl-tRNA synthetase